MGRHQKACNTVSRWTWELPWAPGSCGVWPMSMCLPQILKYPLGCPFEFAAMLWGALAHVFVSLGGLYYRNLLSHSSGGQKSKIMMSAGLVPFKGCENLFCASCLASGGLLAVFGIPLCVEASLQSLPSSFFSFKKILQYNFKGYTQFTVITKYWLYPPCCTVHPYSLFHTQ